MYAQQNLKLRAQPARARARRAAQDGGDFAGAFWLCAQCARALAPLAGLRAAAELGATVAGLYEEGVTRLEAALTAVCADFRAPLYAAVLEGYVHLGNVGALGEEARPPPPPLASVPARRPARAAWRRRQGVCMPPSRRQRTASLQRVCRPPAARAGGTGRTPPWPRSLRAGATRSWRRSRRRSTRPRSRWCAACC